MNTITIQKETLNEFVVDLERLLTDFERILDVSLEAKAEERLNELQSGKTKAFTEEDYLKFIMKNQYNGNSHIK